MNLGPHKYPCGDRGPCGSGRLARSVMQRYPCGDSRPRLPALSYEGSSRAQLDAFLSSSIRFAFYRAFRLSFRRPSFWPEESALDCSSANVGSTEIGELAS